MAKNDPKKEKEEIPAHTREDIRLIYTSILDDIQSTKKQQLEITNYAIGILVAIIYFFNMINEKWGVNFCVKYIMFFLSTIILILGIYYLGKLEKDLEKSRDRKWRAIDSFPEEIHYILFENKKDNTNKETEIQSVVWVYKTLLIIGWFLVTYFVFWRFVLRY